MLDRENRALEETVRERTRTLAAIVENSDDAIISKDLAGVVTWWDAGAERIFGYRAEEAIGRPITFIIPPDRHHEETDVLGRIRRGQQTAHFERVRLTRDRGPLHVALTISPIRDLDGTIVGASKIARDITARKQAEEALRQSEATALGASLIRPPKGSWSWTSRVASSSPTGRSRICSATPPGSC